MDDNRIKRLLEEVSTPEMSDEDPYHDDGGEYGSDVDYQPSSLSDSSSSPCNRYNYSSGSNDDSSSVSTSLLPQISAEEQPAPQPPEMAQPDFIELVQHNLLEHQLPESLEQIYQQAGDDVHVQIFAQEASADNIEQFSNDKGWSKTTMPITDFEFDASSTGPKFDISLIRTPFDMFKYVMPSNLVDYIVQCTNKYAERMTAQGGPRTRNSRNYSFRPVDNQEILTFFGLCLLQGQLKFPIRRNCFSNDPLYYHPIFQHITSGRRFEQILKCLCVADCQAEGEHKVLDFLKALNTNFQQIYSPSKELSIDESLILFRGRLYFRQYIKGKKAKYGIKFYVLTTSDGYLLDMYMYRGKDDSESGKKTQRIVLTLLEPYLLKGHHVFMDNFYNSTELSEKLLDLRTHSCGTLRKNRKGNPRLLTNQKLKKGEHHWLRKGQVYVSVWKDKRPVYVISTRDHPELKEVANRHGKLATKPAEVAAYNNFMGGVDRVDQIISYYSSPRKTIRWYKRVIFQCLDVVIWNSYYLYKKYVKKNTKYKSIEFRDQLIKEMCGISNDAKGVDMVRKDSIYSSRRFRQNIVEECNVSTMTGHWPILMPVLCNADDNKRKFKYLNCKLCTKLKKRKETKYICKDCVKRTPLCPECFEDWH